MLLVGAYERDNFGDLLFLLVTEHCLWGAEVCAAAPFAADMSALLDRTVPAYAPLLRAERFDVVWTVGGQVGAIDAHKAYRYSAAPDVHKRFARASRARQAELLRRAAGGTVPLSPYIPALAGFPRNAGAISVVNSAGVAGIANAEPVRREALLALLRTQTAITVRDRPSSALLTRQGIAHDLEPDVVHAIGALAPAPAGERPDDVAVVQVSSAILGRLGHEQVARALASASSLRGLGFRLIAAGTATGHDDLDDLRRLAHHLELEAPGRDVQLDASRRPMDLVERIRTARVVIGTSLHVRIVAAAYGVPRVTLSKHKPTVYARTWDADMPFDVALDGLDEAVTRARAAGESELVAARSRELTRRAHAHLAGLTGDVLAQTRAQTPLDVRRRAEERLALAHVTSIGVTVRRRGRARTRWDRRGRLRRARHGDPSS